MNPRLSLILATGVFIALLTIPTPVAGQSLWQRGKPAMEEGDARGHGSIYVRAEKKRPAIQVNDILLVDVVERSTASNDARLDSLRETELQLALDQWVRFTGGNLTRLENPQPEIDAEASRETKARGRTDRNENIRLRIAARVVDVLPNGNLVIEARKERRINAELTTLTLSGEVSTADVAADYSVSSERVADMKLAITGEGPVSANTRWTWLSRVIDFIWPF